MLKKRIHFVMLGASGLLAAYLAAAPVSRATEYHSAGKALYSAHCAMCHGPGGKGDGRAACDFKSRPADLTDPDLADETDSGLIRKIIHAPRPMPSFGRLLDENDRREVVAYMRTLAGTPLGSKRP